MYRRHNLILLLLVLLTLPPAMAAALGPEDVAVVANGKARDSVELARYYMERRGIAPDRLITLRTSWDEDMTREYYLSEVRDPVRAALARFREQGRPARVLLVMHGMPLRIAPPLPSWDDEENIARLLEQLQALTDKESPEAKDLRQLVERLRGSNSAAALDSELSLVLQDEYPLEGWQPNPWFLGFQGRQGLLPREEVLLVSRLDGPEAATVRRIIDDSLATEAEGLQGQLCIDARWPRPQEVKNLKGYGLYDAALHLAAENVPRQRPMPLVLDQQGELLQPGRCDNAALYCGWYSVGRYVDAFTWRKGSVGYHIASNECTTLKAPGSTVWCKRMLEEGVAAVIGPVAEPYVEAFPLPDLFFLTLTDGRPSLVESYFLSLPYLSWQMILVGDPLYRPYQAARQDPTPEVVPR